MIIFAERLKELRVEKKLSLEKLAKQIGVSDTAIMKWEQNKSEPTAMNIKLLALYFDVSSDYLLGLEDEDGTKKNITVENSFNGSKISGGIKF